MDHGTLYILLAALFGLMMTWGVGANDLANVMSTTMGSKALSVRNALIIAIIFEFAGAFLGGGNVINTLRHGIINTDVLNGNPDILIYGMLAVLLAGSVWMFLASMLGLPVSITNAIVGSIVGFGFIVLGPQAVHWNKIGLIAISWVASPAIAGVMAYIIFKSIQGLILGRHDPYRYTRRYVPIYSFLLGIILSVISVIKGLKHFGYHLSAHETLGITLLSGVIVSIIGMLIMRTKTLPDNASRRTQFEYSEKVFGVLMGFTACAMIFAHGANDVSIAVGPMTLIVSLVQHTKDVLPESFAWITFLGCAGVVIGLLTYGRKVIATVGTGITSLTPSRAFAATLAAATAVVFSTSYGIPVSTTQTLVGGILGVGLARGIGAINLNIVRNIFMSWIITLPAASILTIVFFYMLKSLFGG